MASSPHKRRAVEDFLTRGSVRILVNPQMRGVRLPEKLFLEPVVILQLGLNLPIPIPDLTFMEDGFTATLSFDRTPHKVVVPWVAVFAVVPDADESHGIVWAQDIPQIHCAPSNNRVTPIAQLVPTLQPKRPRLILGGPGSDDPRAALVSLNAYRRRKQRRIGSHGRGA